MEDLFNKFGKATAVQVPGSHDHQVGPGCGDPHLLQAAGGRGEPAGIWGAEHEYPHQDHLCLLRWAGEPILRELQLWPGLAGQPGLWLELYLLQLHQLLQEGGCNKD